MATLIELYEKLKPKLGEAEARDLLEFIERSVERRAATKEDLERAIATLREEMARLEGELRNEMARIEGGLRAEIQRVRADLLKWTFAFWVGAVSILAGLIVALR